MAKRSARRTRRRGGFIWPFTSSSDSSQPTRTWGQWWRGEPASAPVSPTPTPSPPATPYTSSPQPSTSVMGGKKRRKTHRGGSRKNRSKRIYGHY